MVVAHVIDQRPRHSAPDAGVIEEARGRQRRQRALVPAAITASIAVVLIAALVGGGAMSGTPRTAAPRPVGGLPSHG
jgi:hypothetical protein